MYLFHNCKQPSYKFKRKTFDAFIGRMPTENFCERKNGRSYDFGARKIALTPRDLGGGCLDSTAIFAELLSPSTVRDASNLYSQFAESVFPGRNKYFEF